MPVGIEMSDEYAPLSPAEAVRRMKEDPDSICFTLSEVARAFGMSGAEMLGELQSGRLVAAGTKSDTGEYYEVHIPADSLVRWMAATGRDVVGT